MKNVIQLGGLNPNSSQRSKVYSIDAFCPTLLCPGCGGGGTSLIPMIIEKREVKRKNNEK